LIIQDSNEVKFETLKRSSVFLLYEATVINSLLANCTLVATGVHCRISSCRTFWRSLVYSVNAFFV